MVNWEIQRLEFFFIFWAFKIKNTFPIIGSIDFSMKSTYKQHLAQLCWQTEVSPYHQAPGTHSFKGFTPKENLVFTDKTSKHRQTEQNLMNLNTI